MKAVTKLKANCLLYKEWIKRWKTLPVRSWITAAQLYKANEFEEAAGYYKAGLASHTRHPARLNALLDLSHCLFKMRRFEEAERYLRQATIVAPLEREAYVRLARLQLWVGCAVEAAWTIRQCLQSISIDPELATLFVTAAVESGGIEHLVKEAKDLLKDLHCDPEASPRLEVAKARFNIMNGDHGLARDDLAALASKDRGPFEAVVAFAQVLMEEGKIAYARHHLHRSLQVSPEHPRVLRMLAATYLEGGAFFEPEYAIQIATRACQATGWRGMHEMHILARAYAVNGDKISALLIASKAKDAGQRLLGGYPEFQRLEQLIHDLSSGGTQA
jgi:predicted Zn-dependent protease